MNTISISQLKTNPSKAISAALEYPLAVENRSKIKAYLIGKDLYDKLASYLEDMIDAKAIQETDFGKGVDFEKVAHDLSV
jgi:PHD/YefM family antitoxin component YafN of YafNO toxin-antitoxin module